MGFPIAPRTGTASDPASGSGAAGTRPSALDRLACRVAVVGAAGHAPIAPGTVGSVVAAGAFLAGALASAPTRPGAFAAGLGSAIAATFVLGVWAAGRAEHVFGRHDDGRIVIDEVVGQWIALAPIVPFLPELEKTTLIAAVVTGCVAFRVFDVWKPGAVRWAERRFEGGLGVMADDVVAGAYGALALLLVGLASRSLLALEARPLLPAEGTVLP